MAEELAALTGSKVGLLWNLFHKGKPNGSEQRLLAAESSGSVSIHFIIADTLGGSEHSVHESTGRSRAGHTKLTAESMERQTPDWTLEQTRNKNRNERGSSK